MTTHPPGNYLCCTECGRLLRIEWRTRSIVCSCGARLTPSAGEPAGKAEPAKRAPAVANRPSKPSAGAKKR